MSLVRVEGVTKSYRLGEQTVTALHNITLSFDEGVFLAIAGPSGSGKTTLLNIIGCIDAPSTGKVYIDNAEVTGRSPDDLADLRAHTTGFIFQTFNLFPVLTAAENVEYPLLNLPEITREERQKRVARFLAVVGLEKHADRKPNQLSGGQRQRVAIARALAIKPRIVLADEPTANLDRRTGEEILNLMKDINRQYGTTFIFSTHDRRIMSMADRLIRIEDGRIASLAMKVNDNWKSVRLAAGAAQEIGKTS
ncbi:MAG: ABC transporter ATP-binding protein [Parasulfuritortus sp.]|jgi:putative ABC transport system ATP-binding protein|nr:ABC transporter ATP-binding protein [Parasulfuritortus sp.]